MKPFRLSRRTFLRGAGITGVALGLPVLDAMLNDKGLLHSTAHAGGQTFPVRLISMHIPNGTVMSRWTPVAEGTSYELTPCLRPLGGFRLPNGTEIPAMRGAVNVITGLANRVPPLAATGGGHIRSLAAFANGMPASATGAGGPSYEQIPAARFGNATRFPSLPIAVQPAVQDNWDSASPALFNNLSWSAAEQPVPAERSPRTLFNRLFTTSGSASEEQRRLLYRRSVLDYLKSDVTRLDQRLGSVDRARIDEHLTSIRELERQVNLVAATSCTVADPGDTNQLPGDEFARLMMQLLVTAMRCDLTRYSSLQLYHPGNLYPFLGPEWENLERHGLSHRTDAAAHDLVVIATAYNVMQFAYFAWLFQNVREGTGTMLDNTLIYLSSEVSEGSEHNFDDMPVLLAGRGGGAVATGRHIRYQGSPSFCNLFLSMIHAAGATSVQSFGMDSTGPLPGLGS